MLGFHRRHRHHIDFHSFHQINLKTPFSRLSNNKMHGKTPGRNETKQNKPPSYNMAKEQTCSIILLYRNLRHFICYIAMRDRHNKYDTI